MPVSPNEIVIDLGRDALLSPHAIETLQDRYMVEGETSPQQAFARAAAAFADDAAHGQRLYDYASRGWFMFATPVLSNGGTERGLPISCYLNYMADSRDGINEHYKETSWLSSLGGGVGGYAAVRGPESTSKGSASSGGIPFICIIDRYMLAFSQGKTRRGSYASYMDISHPEFEEFLEIRKPSGGDANRKALNLHHAVNITDDFMHACRADADWHFRSPKTGEIKKTVNARALMRKIVETRHQTGEPFILFKDTANRALPKPLKDKGLKINHSNLCVSGVTPILTSEGYFPIRDLAGQMVEVWNGEEWSEVEVCQTSEGAGLLKVDLSNGASLSCTPYHKWYVVDNYHSKPREVRAAELKVGDKLIKCDFPVVVGNDAPSWDHAYAAGFMSGDGTHADNTGRQQIIWLYGDKRALVDEFRASAQTITFGENRDTVYFGKDRIAEKFSVPHNTDLGTRLEWLAGLLDSDGAVARNGSNESLQIASIHPGFLDEVRLLLNTLGCDPKITKARDSGDYLLPDGKGGLAEYACKTVYRLLLNSNDTYNLQRLGLYTRRLKLSGNEPQRSAKQFVTVTAVSDAGYEPTYCFTEPKRHMGVFNGVLTGNCTEIMLPTAADRTAVCCLSSPNIAAYDEWKDHPLFIEDLMRMLDNVLEDFIQKAPPELWRAVASARDERSVGLGGMGLHTFLQDRMIPWGSDLARAYNVMIFEHIEKKATEASLKLGAERGEAPVMKGTGHRFAHKMAVAPNASSSIFVPNGPISPSIEQWPENIFIHKTLTGSHTVRNPSLERLLESKGKNTKEVWKDILLHEGSVQHLDFLSPMEKMVFATAFETDQTLTIIMANERAPFVDQGVSLNISVPAFVDADYLLNLHFLAWAGGSKSMYYVRSKAPKKAENMNTKVEQMELVVPDDEGCVACEG